MISVVILTKNCSKTIQETLESVKDFPEIVIYDTGSTDDTLAIVKSVPNTKIVHGTLSGFGPTRNVAATSASFDWILALDSDEVLSPTLREMILTTDLNPLLVYRFRRVNFFLGEQMKSCSGWGKDYVNRLYHQKHYSYGNDQVHEKIIHPPDKEKLLHGELFHTPYGEIGDLLKKLQHYSDLFAEQTRNLEKKSGGILNAVLHGIFAFIKSYIFKLGFLQGARGFIISSYIAHCSFYKYLKVWEKQFSQKKS